MGRTIPSGLNIALYRLYSEPITLIELYLTSPYTTPSHYYCVNNEDIVFNSQTYTAIAAKRSSIKSEEGTVLQELTVQLDNIDLGFKTLIASGFLNRKRCDLKLVFNGFLSSSANYITLYSGYLDAPSGDNRWVNLLIKPFPIFEREYPRRLFQVQCNWTFGDTQCGLSLSSFCNNVSIVAGSTSSSLFVVDGNISGYYCPGYAEITDPTSAIYGEVRPIASHSYGSPNSQIGLRVAFSATPETGATIKLQKLCDKSPSSCLNVFNNFINFGGFHTVPKAPVL